MTDIESAIECWASRPTWFSSHPSDETQLKSAISNLKALRTTPSKEEIFEAIYGRIKNLSPMLGTPTDIEKTAREFAAKIFSKL